VFGFRPHKQRVVVPHFVRWALIRGATSDEESRTAHVWVAHNLGLMFVARYVKVNTVIVYDRDKVLNEVLVILVFTDRVDGMVSSHDEPSARFLVECMLASSHSA